MGVTLDYPYTRILSKQKLALYSKCQTLAFHCYALLEERVPRATLKGNSDGFIFGTLKGTSKNPMTGCFVKYPLIGFLLVPLGYFEVPLGRVLRGTLGVLSNNIFNLYLMNIHNLKYTRQKNKIPPKTCVKSPIDLSSMTWWNTCNYIYIYQIKSNQIFVLAYMIYIILTK